jgi:NADPH2 dehydrogenase
METSLLFKPLKMGNIGVKHRIALAPMSRRRATSSHLPTPMMKEFYSQRAAILGTLLFTDANLVSPAASGLLNMSGIWSAEQTSLWKEIVDEVHNRGSFIYCQLVAVGRVADQKSVELDGINRMGPSAIPLDGTPAPKVMTIEEIKQMVQDFANATKNAMKAGFDGVEFDGNNGLLHDQFVQDVTNQRDDEYGGNIENRSRFTYESVKAVADAIGPERVGYRMSPWSMFWGMKMTDPIPQFTDVIIKLKSIGISHIHLIESRICGDLLVDGGAERLDFAYNAWKGLILINGGYTPETAKKLVEEYPDREIIVTFGRSFIANPDLVYKAKYNLSLNQYDRSTFYTQDAEGYIDYPFSKEYQSSILPSK